jgi:hypothetical protein
VVKKGQFSKVSLQSHGGRREMFLTSRAYHKFDLSCKNSDRAFAKGNATGRMNGEQKTCLLRKIEFDAKNINKG